MAPAGEGSDPVDNLGGVLSVTNGSGFLLLTMVPAGYASLRGDQGSVLVYLPLLFLFPLILVAVAMFAPLFAESIAKTGPNSNHLSDTIEVDGEIFAGRARARDILPCCVSAYIDAASNAQAVRDLRESSARKVQAA